MGTFINTQLIPVLLAAVATGIQHSVWGAVGDVAVVH